MLGSISECKIVVKVNGCLAYSVIPVKEAFLPKEWWRDKELGAAYEEAGAPMVALGLEDAHPNYVRQRSIRGDPKPNYDEWRQFLIDCRAAQGPRLLTTELPSDNALPDSAEALHKQCDRVDTDRKPRTVKTVDFDRTTIQLLAARPPMEGLTVAIAELWPQIAVRNTVVSWFYYTSKVRWIEGCLPRCRIVNCLVVRSDQGLRALESTVLNTEENRAVGIGIVPLVEPSRYGGEEFLLSLGATQRINETWLVRLAGTATRASTDEEFISLAGVAMRLAARLVKQRPEARNWIRTAPIFCHWQTRELSSYDDWIAQGGDKGFSAVVANEVLEALEAVFDSSIGDLMDDLFKPGDLGSRNGEVIAWLRRVNDHGRKNEMGLEFANRLGRQGLTFCGNTIHEPSHLPLVWDKFPNPCSSFGFIILPDNALDRSACERAAQLLGWPCLSGRQVEFTTASRERIDELAAKQLQLTSNVLDLMFSEAQGNRPSRSSIMRKARDGRLTVFEATDISLRIEDCAENPEVDFWSKGEFLLFDSNKITLTEAFGCTIDAEASTTIAPFIEGIFDQQKSATKQSVSKNTEAPFPGGSNSVSLGSGKRGESEGAGDSNEERSGGNEAPESSTGPRKRLYSYVVQIEAMQARNQALTPPVRRSTETRWSLQGKNRSSASAKSTD